MLRVIVFAVLVGTGCAGGCGRSVATWQDFCEARQQVECDFQTQCFGIASAACREFHVPDECVADPALVGKAYDENNAAACLDSLAAITCDSPYPGVAGPCAAVVTGKAKAGEACGPANACGAGLKCSATSGCGTCVADARAQLGQACSATVRCDAGLYCVNKQCVAPIKGGDPCTPDSAWLCAAAVGLYPSSFGGQCVPDDPTNPTTTFHCGTGLALDAACTPDDPTKPCKYGTRCDPTTKKCKRMPITGEDCSYVDGDRETQITACMSIGYCKKTGTTTVNGVAMATGVCARFAKTAEACTTDFDAVDLSYQCDGASLRCVGSSPGTPGTCGGQGPGYACQNDPDCAFGCENGKCKAAAACP